MKGIPKYWKLYVKNGIAYVQGMTVEEYRKLTSTELAKIHAAAHEIATPGGFVMAGHLCHIKRVRDREGLQTTMMRKTLHHKVEKSLVAKTVTEKKTTRIEGVSEAEFVRVYRWLTGGSVRSAKQRRNVLLGRPDGARLQ